MRVHGLTFGMFKETFARFGADKAPVWAAALAYSTAFAIAPLLIIAIGIAGAVIGVTNGGHGHHVAEDKLIGTIGSVAGSQAAEGIRAMVTAAFNSHQGSVLAQVLGWATFVLAASGLFMTLQGALNAVWHVEPKHEGIWLTIRNRIASAAMLLVIGVLLLGTIAANFVFSFLWTHFTALLPFPGANIVFTILNYVIDIAIITVMFALIYRYLPDTEIGWGDVWSGSIATSILFVIGEALLSIYISHAGIANGYGAAGSLVILLVWVYYSAMLLLIGAEFTRVYAEKHGSRMSSSAAEDSDPHTRGATAHTSEGSTVPDARPVGNRS